MPAGKKIAPFVAPEPQDLKPLLVAIASELDDDTPLPMPLRGLLDPVHMPAVVPTLLDLLGKQVKRKRPDDDRIENYLRLIYAALAELGYRPDSDATKQAALIAVRSAVAGAVERDGLPAELLMPLLQGFAEARLDAGDELRALLEARLIDAAAELADEIPEGPIDHPFAEFATQFGDDSFAFAEFLVGNVEIMPREVAAMMAPAALLAEEKTVREAALGCLLSKQAAVRDSLLDVLVPAAKAGRIDGVMLRRLIALRNWLGDSERGKVDAAIAACRRSGIDCAPWPKAKLKDIWTTAIDGSGTQSVLVRVAEGRRQGLVGILFKEGYGVRDAWVRHGASKRDIDAMLAGVDGYSGLLPSDLDYLGASLRHYLTQNEACGERPPFTLLDAAEAIGLSDVNPVAQPIEDIIETLCGNDADRTKATGAALAACGTWPSQIAIMESWFDEAPDVLTIAKGRKASAKKLDTLLDGPFNERRHWWATLLARLALARHHAEQAEHGGDLFMPDASALALVARELMGTRPLAEIPLMRALAAQSLEYARFR